MSYSDDESLPGECDWCHGDRGQCYMPHLDEDRRFSIKLEETCWKYALEAIINGYYYISLFMVIVYYSCYNCIVRKS